MNWFGQINLAAPVAESYMNGKPKLTQYYIGQTLRFNSLIIGFFAPIILNIISLIPDAWIEFGMINYLPGLLFIVPRLIRIMIERLLNVAGPVIPAADRPNVSMIFGILSSISTTVLLFVYLAIFKIPTKVGLEQLAWMIELGMLPVSILFSGLSYYYVHKKIVNILVPWKQMLFGNVIPSIITYFCLKIILAIIYIPVSIRFGVIIGIAAAAPFLFLSLLFIYFPLSALFGGWDAINLDEFKKAAEMSGPSKFLVWPLYRILEYFSKKSKLHNSFGMNSEEIIQEAKELFEIKIKNREILKDSL
jgi:hypothetical protein